MPVPDDLVLVAHVTGAFGLDGWIRLKAYSSEASAMLHAKTWWIDKPELHDVDVMQVRMQGEDVVALLMGVVGRNAAEALQGSTIQIRRSHFPPLGKDEFYWIDLIGHEVENLSGEMLGKVVGLMDNGAHPILKVADGVQLDPKKPEELLIPFVDRFVTKVDQSAKKITVDWQRDY
ncbi:MAG: ribosome maturation factor RimM [Burkholderiaceae bacterium]|jgi:16S rRNA processing protein RimM